MGTKKRIVIAIGGNSLIEDNAHVTVGSQYEAARKTAAHIVRLAAEDHQVIIAHGNGPQVGYILLRAEFSRKILHTVPLDSCVADTQGAIGYNLQMALRNEAVKAGIQLEPVTVVTQVVVDPADPSFQTPSKPIGGFMTQEDAEYHRNVDGWSIVEDSGRGYRRVVPSPRPKRIVEIETIRRLLDAGSLVIAAGGGGIPVQETSEGSLAGLEAVIDKDLAASLMAVQLQADLLVISTAVPRVCIDYRRPTQREIDVMTAAEAQRYVSQGQFAPGSMLPKIEAVLGFIGVSGNPGIITDPVNIHAAVSCVVEGRDQTYGTRIVP